MRCPARTPWTRSTTSSEPASNGTWPVAPRAAPRWPACREAAAAAGRRRADPAPARAARRRARRHQPGPSAAAAHRRRDRDRDCTARPAGGGGFPPWWPPRSSRWSGPAWRVAQPWRDDSSITHERGRAGARGPRRPAGRRRSCPAAATATVVRSADVPPGGRRDRGRARSAGRQDLPAVAAGRRPRTMVSAGLMPAGDDTCLLEGNADDASAAGLSARAGGRVRPADRRGRALRLRKAS